MSKRASTELNLNFLNNYTLEDEVYLRIDKLQALCAAQVILNNGDTPMASIYVAITQWSLKSKP